MKRSQVLQSGSERSYQVPIYRLSSLIDVIRCLVTFVVYLRLRTHLPRRHCNCQLTPMHTGTPAAADWKRPLGRPRRTWLQQVKEDCGISVGLAQITSQDRLLWRSLRPSVGQAQQWVNEWVSGWVCTTALCLFYIKPPVSRSVSEWLQKEMFTSATAAAAHPHTQW